jgi:predicted permease
MHRATSQVPRIGRIDDLRQDAQYAFRTFRRSPGFVAVAVLTLALGIGATTAIFSVVYALLLKPLPYPGSDRIVRLMMNMPPAASPTGRPLRTTVGLTPADVLTLRSRTRTLEDVGTAGPALMGFVGYEDAGHLQGARVSSTVFDMLGARPHLGRVFGSSDERPGADEVIVLSYSAWQRHFGGDPRILGRTLTLGHVLGPRRQSRHVVVGIMPAGFEFPYWHTRFWLPFQAPVAGGGASRGPLLARLAARVPLQAAAAEIGAIVRDIRRDPETVSYELVREQDEMVAPVKPALVVLMVAVGFVLFIACANVTNLLLARASARQREMAIRAALGAARGRLVRQLLTESLLLALAGGVSGVGLAIGGVALLRSAATTLARIDLGTAVNFPRLDEIAVDTGVLAFTLCLSVIAGVLCGIAPAVRESLPGQMDTLRGGVRAIAGFGRGHRTQGVLVIAEIALAMMVLVCGGLLIRSFIQLSRVEPGYDAANVLTFQVSLPADRYPDDRLRAFAEEVVARLGSIPGVRAAAYANQLPMVQLRDTAGGLWRTPDATRKSSPGGPDARFVSRDYLDAMGIRVIAGRGFREEDGAGQPRVLLVNEALARREFGGTNAIGHFVYVGRDTAPWEIVGVVDNVLQFGLDREPEPQFFADFRQLPQKGLPLFPVGAYYAIRMSGAPLTAVADVRRVVSELDEHAKLFNVVPMAQLVATTISRPRMYATLLGIFAAVSVVLAAVGVFGVIAFSVAQRTREIGIRLALGAQRSTVMGLVLRQTAMLTAVGIVLGVAGAAAIARYLEGMLFGLSPLDLTTFGAVVVLFAAVAVSASYIPARRAMNVDPLTAIRDE